MAEGYKPSITEVRKPLSDILKAILQYQEDGRNPFLVKPMVLGVTGPKGGHIVEVTLDNPASLEQEQYDILYNYGKSNNEDEYDSIARLTRLPQLDLVDVAWGNLLGDPRTFRKIPPRSEEGCRKLERILSSFAYEGR